MVEYNKTIEAKHGSFCTNTTFNKTTLLLIRLHVSVHFFSQC